MTDEPNRPDSPDAGATPDTNTPRTPPADETPDERRARLTAEAQAKGTASATDTSPAAVSADEEKAAKIAEAKARATAAKEAAGAKGATPPAAGAPKAPVKKKEEGPKPTDASAHPLVKKLRAQFGEAVIEATEFLGQLSVRLAPTHIVRVCESLRRDAETPFDLLCDVTCVHWPERAETPFEVVYNLYSIKANTRVRLKVWTSESVGSVTGIWPTANWLEREVYDLFGVTFTNHPDMRRLLLPPDWQGHPLRKEYPLKPVENAWTRKHLPPFDEVQHEQLEQSSAYGLEILQTPDERRIRELYLDGRDPLPKEHK